MKATERCGTVGRAAAAGEERWFCEHDRNSDFVGWRKWVTVGGALAILVLFAMLLSGCLDDGADGATGEPGPRGEQGPRGEPGLQGDERYISITNPAGDVTSFAITTTGDNSPVDFDVTINAAGGDDSAAGTRREDVTETAQQEE